MKPEQRITIATPLTELWDDTGDLHATKLSSLSTDAVRDLLREGPISMVLAESGSKLIWIDGSDVFPIWKSQLRSHICSEERVTLEDYLGGYCYHASLWLVEPDRKVILLEKTH